MKIEQNPYTNHPNGNCNFFVAQDSSPEFFLNPAGFIYKNYLGKNAERK
jgi:hypothetical protein